MTVVPLRAKRSANEVSRLILDAAMKVHSVLGPGLLESAYEACLAQELRLRGLDVQTQVPLPVVYEGTKLEVGYRVDMLVEGVVVIEVKSVDGIAPIHEAQLLSYLKLSGRNLGLLLNFNTVHLKDGIRRFVMGTGWQ
ncbi:MAG TPA: GxxExxY protein [Terriglobales bacterium]|nr:GxxExxY protein [Terriglobales bacterium]